MTRCLSSFVVALAVISAANAQQDVSFLNLPAGYVTEKIPLGSGNYAQALAADPASENFVYAAGQFGGARRIVRLDLRSGAWSSVLTCPTTFSVSGLAVLAADTMFVTDAHHDRLYLLRDERPRDGNFDDPGEIRELIKPILTKAGDDWTGTAVLIVRSASNRLHLPAGAVLFQSEDGNMTQGEVLAVVSTWAGPSYQPPGKAFFSGFNYGGGLAMDSLGRLLVASSFYPNTGKVWICDDLNGDAVIGTGEANILVPRASGTTETAGLSGLAIDAANRCYVTVGWGSGPTARTDIQVFTIPGDPLHQTAPTTTFASLKSPYVSALVFNTASRSFAAWSKTGATLVILAFGPMWEDLDYLLTIRPTALTGVAQWRRY